MASIIGRDPEEKKVKLADNEWFEHIQGFKNVVLNARAVLKKAKSSVYINADFPITELWDELEFLVDNDIIVSVFSFYDLGKVPAGVNVFTHNHKMQLNHVCTRLMIAVDEQEILLADSYGEENDWRGTKTNNPLMVNLVCEHIHNDIYLMQIRLKYGREIYDNVMMDDSFERMRREKGIF